MSFLTKPDRSRMLTGTPWKEVLIFSIPLMLGTLLQNVYGVVDTILVGTYQGEEAMGAVATTSVLVVMLLCISWGLSSGVTAVLSRYNGSGNTEEFRECLGTATLFTIIIGLLVVTIGAVIGEFALRYIMGVPEEIMDFSLSYFYLDLIGVFFIFQYNVQGSFLKSAGNSVYLFYVLLCTCILNIFLDVLFISVFDWGVKGAAAATSICHILSFIIVFILIRKNYPELSKLGKNLRLNGKYVNEIKNAGLPMIAQQMVIFGGLLICQNPINGFGVDMTAANGVEKRIETMMRIPMTAFSAGMLTFTGMAYGAKNKEKLISGVKQIWTMSMSVAIIISIPICILTPWIIACFPLEEQSYKYAVEYLRVISLSLPLFVAYYAIHGFFQGIKKPFVCTIITTTELIIRVVLLFALSSVVGYSIVWWSVPIAWAFATALSLFFFIRYRKTVVMKIDSQPVAGTV